MLLGVIVMFEICCFSTTMTIWVMSSHSNSQEKSLIMDNPRKLF